MQNFGTLISLRSITSICIGTLMLSGCSTTTESGAIGADRQQLLLVSSQEMNAMADKAYDELTEEAREQGILNKDQAMLQRLRTIGQRIRPQTAVFRADAPNWEWELNVLQSEELNAFCMPGGKIAFYSGLIEKLNLSDAEIAVVMGHEVAHALREHSREQMSQDAVAQTAISLGATLLGLGRASADLASTGYGALVATKFSRNDEAEADRIGLELMARAGYDPRAGVTLWQKMMNANQGGRPPELLSSHPAEQSRVREIESLLPTVLPLYEAARQ